MNKNIKILDCTLRDGGYVNDWSFSNENIKNIIESLTESSVEIIECGFLSEKTGKLSDSSNFENLGSINKIIGTIGSKNTNTDYCVMINLGEVDILKLTNYNSSVDFVNGIRLAFHKNDLKEAFNSTKIIIEKGYKVFVQPMVTLSYTDQEICELIDNFNKLDIYAMYIVDSFGAMLGDDFRRLHYLFENNLKQGVRLGYHSHNNLQMAYSNAIDFINIKNNKREIVIDSSIQGMGRGAGNLTTELLADYLNKKEGAQYNIIPILEIIDKYLNSIYRENYWGYSIAHFLSASFGCHPNYASFLVNKKNLSIVNIQYLLGKLNVKEKENYNKNRIEELYIEFKSQKELSLNFENKYFEGSNILILAPGPNASFQNEKVKKCIDSKQPVVIAVNHIPTDYSYDYVFFSNQKRFDKFLDQINFEKVILTTNIHVNTSSVRPKVVDYHDLTLMTSNKNDNATILLLNLFIMQGIKEVNIAGFDGYKFDSNNYNYIETDRVDDKKALMDYNEQVKLSLIEIRKNLKIDFVTDSIFELI